MEEWIAQPPPKSCSLTVSSFVKQSIRWLVVGLVCPFAATVGFCRNSYSSASESSRHSGLHYMGNLCLQTGNLRWRVKSAYYFLMSQHGVWFGEWRGPQRIRAFWWLVRHDHHLLTNKLLVATGLCRTDACTACALTEETVLRALGDCPRVRAMWEEIVPRHEQLTFFTEARERLLVRNLNESTMGGSGPSWAVKVGIDRGLAWMWRNNSMALSPGLGVKERYYWLSGEIRHSGRSNGIEARGGWRSEIMETD